MGTLTYQIGDLLEQTNIPKIGAGLARGSWGVIEQIILEAIAPSRLNIIVLQRFAEYIPT